MIAITKATLVAILASLGLALAAQAAEPPKPAPVPVSTPPAAAGSEFLVRHGEVPRGKPPHVAETVCWLPQGIKHVRGVVIGGPMIAALATEERFHKMAAEEGLGTMRAKTSLNFPWAEVDDVLARWAEASGHPELRGAPLLFSGLSASVLWARLMVYEKPERCFGLIHVVGGNMHQSYPEGKSLAGVPFMAVNGEYENCGPDGGIQPHLGFDKQWYMMGEQMLERRRQDPSHLMHMVVIPMKGHSAWNMQLAELFIRKCAAYRLPKEKRDGSTPAVCRAVPVESGWLSHRNVKHPPYPPAAWADYPGNKGEAFWHLDEEMALAVAQYHRDGIRPGQSRTLFRPAGLFEELWPLGQRMDIAFKGATPEAHAATLREWIDGKTAGRLGKDTVRFLAEGIAAGLQMDEEDPSSSRAPGERDSVAAGTVVDEARCRKRCLRVCYAYDDAYRPVADAIEKTKLPEASKSLLRAHYAEQLLVQWPNGRLFPELTIRGIQVHIGHIPAGSDADAVSAWIKAKTPPAQTVLSSLYGATPGPRPAGLDALLEELKQPPSKQW